MYILLLFNLIIKTLFIFYFPFQSCSFSIIAAAPIPVPIHIEITPYFYFYLLNSGSKVAIYLAPVHPNGWPMAIAPPLGFTFFISRPSFSQQ